MEIWPEGRASSQELTRPGHKVQVAQAGLAAPGLLLEGSLFGLRRATRDPGVGGAVLQTSVCSSRLKAKLARTPVSRVQVGLLRGLAGFEPRVWPANFSTGIPDSCDNLSASVSLSTLHSRIQE